tara:strand:+ start:1129 stop:1569 length:441 start_codon:yes stop_codon:yes gene_type:complete
MLKFYKFSIFLAILLNSTACMAKQDKNYNIHTSVVHVLSAPEQYYDKNILIDGFFVGYAENNLYFSSEHAEHMLRAMGVNVLDDTEENSLSFSSCNGEWVEMWGTYISAVDQQVSYFKGRLVVDEVIIHKTGKTCWKRTEKSRLKD